MLPAGEWPYSDGKSNIVSVSLKKRFLKIINGSRWFFFHLTVTVVVLLSLRHLSRKTALVLCRPIRETAFFLTFWMFWFFCGQLCYFMCMRVCFDSRFGVTTPELFFILCRPCFFAAWSVVPWNCSLLTFRRATIKISIRCLSLSPLCLSLSLSLSLCLFLTLFLTLCQCVLHSAELHRVS